MDKEKTLTTKQQLFIVEYLKDFNASRAARDAGYSEDSAEVIGSENLKKPYIKKAITEHINLIVGNKDKIVIQNINFWVSVREDTEATYTERLKASEHLAKYAEMFKEKVELSTIDNNGKSVGILNGLSEAYDEAGKDSNI